jgi:hypothetical protein
MEQQLELFRVSERIGQLVVEFFDAINLGETFHAEDLHKFIDRRVKSAPGSADRVMRDLRRKGVIGYSVVNRRESLYVKE